MKDEEKGKQLKKRQESEARRKREALALRANLRRRKLSAAQRDGKGDANEPGGEL